MGVRAPSFNQSLSNRFDRLTQEEFDRFVDAHPIRKQFYKRMRKEQGFDRRDTEAALDGLRQTVLHMDTIPALKRPPTDCSVISA